MHYARVHAEGTIETEKGSAAASPTRAMQDVVGPARNPWAFWQVEETGDRLDAVRQRYLDRFRR